MKKGLIGSVILVAGLSLVSCFDESSVNPNQRLREDIQAIDNYLAANPPAEGEILIRDASGLRMVITETGTGLVPPTLENIIQVSYVGRRLVNGALSSVFDEDESFTLTLTTADKGSDVIMGWKLALRMMTEGTKARVYIPSILGYGPRGSGSIPANANLVFDIELNVVHTMPGEQTRLASDISTIDEYIDEKNIPDVQVHPSGLRYAVQHEGTGQTPGLYDQVVIRHTGRLMNEEETVFIDNTQLGPSEDFSSRTINYVPGLIYGLQLMSEGGKATFYLPSPLGLGPHKVDDIPANSILIYEVELLEVIPNQQ